MSSNDGRMEGIPVYQTLRPLVLPVLIALLPACLEWAPLEHGRCGDGHVGPEERCDDGNTASGDGCSATCKLEPFVPELDAAMPEPEPDAGLAGLRCGDGTIDADEVCD